MTDAKLSAELSEYVAAKLTDTWGVFPLGDSRRKFRLAYLENG